MTLKRTCLCKVGIRAIGTMMPVEARAIKGEGWNGDCEKGKGRGRPVGVTFLISVTTVFASSRLLSPS